MEKFEFVRYFDILSGRSKNTFLGDARDTRGFLRGVDLEASSDYIFSCVH